MSAKKGHIQTCRTKCSWRGVSACKGDVNLYFLNREPLDDYFDHLCDYHALNYDTVPEFVVLEHDPQNKECKFE